MRRSHLKARLLRALSGKTQEEFGDATEIHGSQIKNIELGRREPTRSDLRHMTEEVGLAESDPEEMLRDFEARRERRQTRRSGAEDPVRGLGERLREHVSAAYQRLLELPRPERPPRAEDRGRAAEQWERLKDLPEETVLGMVKAAEDFQNWALCERVCEESERAASQNLERAAALARVAREIAERLPGPEAWRNRMRGYAAAHEANVMRVVGQLKEAEAALEQAESLWARGSDPAGVLDPGRLLDLEASLRRDQRRFEEALARLDEAEAVGRSRERVLIKKGFTLEVMGEYERAIEALLQAAPWVDQETDPRLWNILNLNLANNFCHVGRYEEATRLIQEVRPLVAESGGKIDLIRITWLEGRIAAGLGQTDEARRLLADARQRFAAEGMSYDVALALLEEAVLLLQEGRAAEVKEIAGDLTRIFEDQGVHREALAALQLFQKAAEREAATAELARRVLRYLYQARHDQGLRFNGS